MKKSILVIDDDVTVRALIKARMGAARDGNEGYQVLLAENGARGLELAAEQRPGLILLDWMMPGMGGLEVLSRLKTTPATADIPVVMLTAKKLMGDIERALEQGAEWYLTKPVDLDKLIRRVKQSWSANPLAA
ncbi:MAG: response regulator [Alphaproteobacteria bacterium]|jgi:CheY-like chemotaxis protein|nr:two-component system response regulator [Rhodospirillaceae bacterium]MDP6405417.1 response regulator [Alphaproteobacteria bacterium]MDP6624322.1 response regulator [Alphaproteobacteria bacterium]|tara:strand:- start:2470 stop:2868 length:399 start_codon:yes stop_codon:yes gene_type:complete